MPSRSLVVPRPAGLVPTLILALMTGCTALERGVEQGDPPTDPVTGCPDLSGRYALRPVTADGDPDPRTDPAKPSRLNGGVFSPKGGQGNGAGDLASYEGVVVRSDGTHAIEWQFVHPFSHVMADLEAIREFQRPRYAEWYALMQPASRAAFVARDGDTALKDRLRTLGPRTGTVVRLNRGRDYSCEKGWVIVPRDHLPPVRMTLDAGGHLVFESKEWTYSEWGGWGGQSWRVPTGAYLGTARWARDASVRPWDADEVWQRYVFARPADVVEEERASAAASARRSAERRYADPDAVRDALRPLLPDGLAIAEVDIAELPFIGHRVRVRAVPSDPSMASEDQRRRLEWFLAALKDGDPGFIEDREVVKRVIASGGTQRHEFEIFLDTHPAVQPPRDPVAVSFTPAPGDVVPPVATPMSADRVAERAAPALPASDPVPAGFAMLSEVEGRLVPLMANGCRSTQLRYAGTALIIVGDAADMPCVSNTLRAIDGVVSPSGARVELMQIAADGAGRYRFEIRLPESPLTKA